MALPEASRRLPATFQAAFDFGLSDEEVWEVILQVTKRLPDKAPINESLDAMAEALARDVVRPLVAGRPETESSARTQAPERSEEWPHALSGGVSAT
jgi:hypothetical protein